MHKSMIALAITFVVAAPLAAQDTDPVIATAWELVEVAGASVAVPAQLSFTADAKVFGFAGCNNFQGAVEEKADGISFSPLAATRKLCAETDVMAQEDAVLAAFGAVAGISYSPITDMLTLADEDGAALLRYTRSVPE